MYEKVKARTRTHQIESLFGSHGPMRPKARGLAQHGGPSGWLEESDPAGVKDGPYRMPFRTVPVALTGAFQLRSGEIFFPCDDI
jgi:hypothetical protein